MKLLTIDSREVAGRPGALLSTGDILDLAASPETLSESQWIPYSIVSVLAAGRAGLEHVARQVRSAEGAIGTDRERLKSRGALLPFNGTALMAPVRRPGLVLVVDRDLSAYIKSPNTAVGNGASVQVPWAGKDFVTASGMLAAVIGRPLFGANPAEAAESIVGYTLLIDLSMSAPGSNASVAEWRRYMESKQFPGASPIGPVIITRDEISNPGRLTATARINEVEMAGGDLYGSKLDIPGIVSTVSQRYAFRPGDLVAVESPQDEGPGRPLALEPGDRYSFRLGGLAELDVTIK